MAIPNDAARREQGSVDDAEGEVEIEIEIEAEVEVEFEVEVEVEVEFEVEVEVEVEVEFEVEVGAEAESQRVYPNVRPARGDKTFPVAPAVPMPACKRFGMLCF